MSTEGLIRISIHFRRQQGMSERDFHDHYANVHGPLVTAWLLRHGIVKYAQFHMLEEHRKAGRKWAESQGRSEPPPFDGISDIYVRRFEDLGKAFEDPEYLDKIRPDELRFVDPESVSFGFGTDVLVVEDGKAVMLGGEKKAFEK